MSGWRCRGMRPIWSTQVKALLPEGQAVALWDKGITELPLARLNARLVPYGYVIHARKGQDRTRLVACADEDGMVTPYGVFELRPMPPEASGRTNGTRGQGKIAPLLAIGTQSSLQERKR